MTIKNIDLSSRGRNEVILAEKDMPGLMSLRERYGKTKPRGGISSKLKACSEKFIRYQL